MELFISNGYHGVELDSINICRVYLQEIHRSDISTGSTKQIYNTSYQGTPNYCLITEYEWPTQDKPRRGDWVA